VTRARRAFVYRLKMPAGYRPPHFHKAAENVTVLGVFYLGSAKFDQGSGRGCRRLRLGAAEHPICLGGPQETVVQVHGVR
jgi:hypothetical protein